MNRALDITPQVIVSGAGYTGLLATLVLAQNTDAQILLIEAKNKDFILMDDNRSFALSRITINLLKSLSLWEKIEQFTQPIDSIYVFENNSSECMNFRDFQMGCMIKSQIFKKILLEQVLFQPNIELLENYIWQDIVFKDNTVLVDKSLKAQMFLATEGRNSKLISYFNLTHYEYSYNQTAIVFEITHQENHNATAIEKFFSDGMIAALPLVGGHSSAIVWINSNEYNQSLKDIPQDSFKDILTKRLEGILGEIEIFGKRLFYNLELSFLKKYFYKNILFLGDTNHAIHPIAGQGFNLTVADIIEFRNLLKIYNWQHSQNTLFENFQKKRYIHNMSMIGFTHFLNKLFTNNNFFLKKTRRVGIKLINKIPIVEKMMKIAAGANN